MQASRSHATKPTTSKRRLRWDRIPIAAARCARRSWRTARRSSSATSRSGPSSASSRWRRAKRRPELPQPPAVPPEEARGGRHEPRHVPQPLARRLAPVVDDARLGHVRDARLAPHAQAEVVILEVEEEARVEAADLAEERRA